MKWQYKKYKTYKILVQIWMTSSLVLMQRAKKVVSDSLGLVDFVSRLVNSVFHLPDGQVMFFEEFELQKNCEINSTSQNVFGAS